MKRVVWVGKVARAELAVVCPTCNATIGDECDVTVFKNLPHLRRQERAEVYGFRDVLDPEGLFL